jgi:gliding motility-associated-like protein
MRCLILIFFVASLLLSCSKEESLSFDDSIGYARDFKIDPATGDTIFQVFLPNAFTPNGDGKNDYYLVYGEGIMQDNFSMQIYERNGNLIFSSNDKYKGWDGRMQGFSTIRPQDMYCVLVSAADSTGEIHRYNYKIILRR